MCIRDRIKPDPVELKKDVVRRKLIFIALIAALVGLTHAYMRTRSSESTVQSTALAQKPASENNHDQATLGDTTRVSAKAREEFLTEASENIQTTASTVEKTTQELIDDTKEKVNTSFNDLIYTTTIKPIIAKIQSLPSEQQVHIQDAICKPPAP